MLTLNFSEEEIQRLKYEKDFNPSARMHNKIARSLLKDELPHE